MYQLTPDTIIGPATTVRRIADNAFIPFDLANTDYQTFKEKVLAGVELQDVNGNVISQEQADEFIKELP
jgi:antitoxin component of RelBE/YafQ-DinJ toxin-antitoxin module